MRTVFFWTEQLKQYLIAHPLIIRAKGYIQTETGWNLFNYSLSGCIFEPCLSKEQNVLVIIVENSPVEKYSFEKLLSKAAS